uniref:Uncharacterized protein n=1 Tax=Otus sunia TaxID=257818 RepID=A0A8C8B3X6_9STRI
GFIFSLGPMLFLTFHFENLYCYFAPKQHNNRLQHLVSSRPPVNKSSVTGLTSAYRHPMVGKPYFFFPPLQDNSPCCPESAVS